MSLAWHIARLGSFDPQKFPKLKSLMMAEGPAPSRAQAVDEQIAVLRGIFAARSKASS